MLLEQILERRGKPRIRVAFPMTIRGFQNTGERFEEPGVLDNISASGLYFHTCKLLHPGDQVLATIHLMNSDSGDGDDQNYLVTTGDVVRVDYPTNETFGVAVQIKHYRFQ